MLKINLLLLLPLKCLPLLKIIEPNTILILIKNYLQLLIFIIEQKLLTPKLKKHINIYKFFLLYAIHLVMVLMMLLILLDLSLQFMLFIEIVEHYLKKMILAMMLIGFLLVEELVLLLGY